MKGLIVLAMLVIPIASALADTVPWHEMLKIGGDFRYRHELIDKAAQEGENHRHRIRARLKTEFRVEESADVVLQLATGNQEATSTNQTLDDTYNNKEFELDMAYVQLALAPQWKVLGGKMKNIFYAPGSSDLLFDSDLTPEGLAGQAAYDLNQEHHFFSTIAAYWYEERDGEGSSAPQGDTMQYSAQVGFNSALEKVSLEYGVGHHIFAPIRGYAPLGAAKGNRLSGSNTYQSRYETAEAFLTSSLKIIPLNLYGHYLHNFAADDKNLGYLVGLSYGRFEKQGDWGLDYNYRKTEADAALGYLTDSDFADGESNSRGHRIKVHYQLWASTGVSLLYLKSARNVDSAKTDYDRGQLDFLMKF